MASFQRVLNELEQVTSIEIGLVPKRHVTQPRPRDMSLVFLDGSGREIGSKNLTVKDVPTPQLESVSAHGVVRMEIHVNSVYASTQGHATAIAEIEFFKKA